MLPLVLGLALFIGIHTLPMQPALRQGLASRFGEGAIKGTVSVVAAAGLALIVLGYHKVQLLPGKNPQLWSPPLWGRHATMAVMLPVFPLLLAAYVPGRIKAAVRHPMLLAVKLWALAHLLVRGDMASMLLFGSLLAWAIADRISVGRRERAGLIEVRAAGGIINDVIAVVAGLLLYGLFARFGHELLIGVPLLPG